MTMLFGHTAVRGLRRSRRQSSLLPILLMLVLSACGDPPWNNPNPPAPDGLLTYQSVMSPAPPKHLDPAISYASDESLFIMQIYEPPMAYHFLKRPYELEPGALVSSPTLAFLDASGNPVADGSDELAFTRYTLNLRDTLHYQPHPAFAKNGQGEPLYLFTSAEEGAQYRSIPDFPETGHRPVHASDYAYAIKRPCWALCRNI